MRYNYWIKDIRKTRESTDAIYSGLLACGTINNLIPVVVVAVDVCAEDVVPGENRIRLGAKGEKWNDACYGINPLCYKESSQSSQ